MRRTAAGVAALLLGALLRPAAADAATCPAYPGVSGSNPSYAATAALLESAAAAHGVPPQVLKAIAYREGFEAGKTRSRWVHFRADGSVLVSADCGVGIMQITNAPGFDEAQLGSDIAYNIDAGATILRQKYDSLQPDPPGPVGTDDPARIENWYAAIQRYNGGSNDTSTYVDPVVHAVRNPQLLMPDVAAWSPAIGFVTPREVKPDYVFPAGFQARAPSYGYPYGSFAFHDSGGVVQQTRFCATRSWSPMASVSYGAGVFGPEGPAAGPTKGAEFWRVACNGHRQRMRWTRSNGPTVEGAAFEWSPVLTPASYEVSAYIPSAHASAHARYDVVGGSTLHVTVDQAAKRGRWVVLGQVATGPGNRITVHLSDRGDAVGATEVGADAVRFVRPATTLALAATPTVTYGGTASLTATLRRADSAAALAGRTVAFYARVKGATAWTAIGSSTTSTSGVATRTHHPTRHMEYQARFAGAGVYLASTSPTRATSVRTLVKATLSRTTFALGGTVTISGSVAPSHAGQTVRIERLTGTGWVPVTSATLSGSSAYSAVVKPTARGQTSYRVRKLADADHAEGISPTRTVTVT